MKKKTLFLIAAFTTACLIQIQASAAVLCGIDVLERDRFALLSGAHVALITNQTGVDRKGVSTVDLLSKAPGVALLCILTPEHGFRGVAKHGEVVQNSIDEKTGVPIYSLYGKTTRPTVDMLQDVDTIVFDIQDSGTRFYTYIATMGQALEIAAERKLRFIVLDRPNPIRGDILEGDVLDPEVKRLTGYFPIPTRHGFTVGELAEWMNKTQNLQAPLTVVKMEGWKRSLWFNQTGLAWIRPSPNLPTPTSALLYSGVGCFEATNVSVGRGTKTPFELFGAPWMDGKALAKALRDKKIPGLSVTPVQFTPKTDLYQNERCEGVRIRVTNRDQARPFLLFVHSFLTLSKDNPAFKPNWEEVRVVTGSNRVKDAVDGKWPLEELLRVLGQRLDEFRNQVKSFYLY